MSGSCARWAGSLLAVVVALGAAANGGGGHDAAARARPAGARGCRGPSRQRRSDPPDADDRPHARRPGRVRPLPEGRVRPGVADAIRRFLTPRQAADRFGPSRRRYDLVLGWLRAQGLDLVEESANRLTLTVRGTRAEVERAFDVTIGEYRIGDTTFRANDRNPRLPRAIAPAVQAIVGLTDLQQPASRVQAIVKAS